MTGTLLTSFLALMVTGIPVAIAMAGSALIYIWVTGNTPSMVVVHRMISGIDSFPLLAVPFFILAGNLMNNAGITTRIYNFALALVGWLKGGLGHVNVLGSVIFGLIIHLGTIPGQNDTDLLTAFESVPGAVLGMAAVWFLGVRTEERDGLHHEHA